MTRKTLELRPLPYIAAGYALGPFVGITAMCLSWSPAGLFLGASGWLQMLIAWIWVLMVGGVVCLAIELAMITPILIGFRRYRWPWLNGWTGVGLGLLIGLLLGLAMDAQPPIPGSSEWGQYNVAYVINGVRTAAGWRQVAVGVLTTGLAGGVTAFVFRLIAVRVVVTDEAPVSPNPLTPPMSRSTLLFLALMVLGMVACTADAAIHGWIGGVRYWLSIAAVCLAWVVMIAITRARSGRS